jgi:hypothetical protein
MNNRYSQSY